MNARRLCAWLLASIPAAASCICFADEAPKTPPAPVPGAAAATTTAPAAANAKPAKAPEPVVKPPDEGKLRTTLTKSLTFLAREGDEWVAEKSCNGCHHMPELIWSHREAIRRGFPVDQAKFDGWVAWANDNAPKKTGGAEEAALMILANPDQPAPEVVKAIRKEQKPDGTFGAAGQFHVMQARDFTDAKENSLRLFLLALGTAPSAQADFGAALMKASTALQKKDPPKTLESLAFGVLFADRFDQKEEAAALRAEILKHQRADGGWSYILGVNHSDPLATGQALYVLRPTDLKTSNAIARAQNWLVGLQRENGSWPTDYTYISQRDRSAPGSASHVLVTGIYTYWGTAWSTIGMLQSVPVKETPAVAAAAAK